MCCQRTVSVVISFTFWCYS
uniref:Uncharacterized protein n=1 Tax=Arundo donax TaxID=35708 RepID=A0A0A9EKT9_ARUDO